MPILLARSVLQEMKRELKELREKQDAARATLGQLVADTANRLQEQVGMWGGGAGLAL
mgnify:FL=1